MSKDKKPTYVPYADINKTRRIDKDGKKVFVDVRRTKKKTTAKEYTVVDADVDL